MNKAISVAMSAVLAVQMAANSAQVSEAEAEEAVRGWLALREALGGVVDAQPASVARHTGKDGKGVFYVVSFAGGGYAVVSGDTELEPILAYSTEGEWIDDESRNPLLAMLNLDIAAASSGNGESSFAKATEDKRGTGNGMRLMTASAVSAAAESNAAKRWAKLKNAAASAGAGTKKTTLLAASVTSKTDAEMSAADLRVAPLIQSKWGQGDVGGSPCYNSCTPLNRLAGCVATMMAQIMYYHKWPQGEVTFGKKNRFGADRWSYGYGANSGRAQVEVESGTFGYYEVWANELLDGDGSGKRTLNGNNINGYQSTVAQAAQSRYSCDLTPWEPAFGGTYDWENMVDSPAAASSAGTLTEANRLAIGHLLRDVGLTVPIRYELGGGEGSAHATLALSLVDTFQYADAVFKSGVDADVFRNGILANLDAKLPVGVTVPGHAIVADGYGYADGVLYVHFNMGWNGTGDAWYMPPVIYEGAAIRSEGYNTINTLLYNIRPQGDEADSIVSGRVLDPDGNPVAGVTVSAGGSRSCATDANGIYSLFLPEGDHDISAAVGSTVARTNLTVAATTNPYIYKDGVRNEGVEGRFTSVGNVWGVDLVLPEPGGMDPAWIDETADTTGQTGSWSGDFEWNSGTKRGEMAGCCEFTPTVPSGGNLVNVSVDVVFPEVEAGATPGAEAITAIQIGTNGSFQVWASKGNGEQATGGGWVDVAADGVTPTVETEYSFALSLDYRVKLFSVSLLDGSSILPLAAADGTTRFPFADSNSTAVSSVAFLGVGSLAAIRGCYFTVEGFEKGEEVVVKDSASVILSAAQAAWLNGLGEKATVAGKAATVSAEDFGKAHLLNLDITQDGFGYTFNVTGIEVGEESVAIAVSLQRTGAVTEWQSGTAAPINGKLRFYGAATVEAFTNPALEPLGNAVLSDDDFSDGETATAVIPLDPDADAKFYKARIEER